MNLLKKKLALLLAVVLCLGLTACDVSNDDPDPTVVGNDWRVTGVVRDGGTITRNGEDTVVLVCIHASDATFYHDTEDQVLFDSVDYPITLESDAWEAFRSIDFADLNGDGNSDVTMKFNDGGKELLMVWFWDTGSNQFVYRQEESQLGEDDDGRGDPVPNDGDAVPVLMGDALPFTNMETLQSENHEDGTYYYADVTEDWQILVVNTVLLHDLVDDAQTLEDDLTGCAPDLREADTCLMQTVADEVKSVYQGIFAGRYLSDGE